MATLRKDRMSMARLKSIAALVAIAAATTACGSVNRQISPINNPGVYSQNQPVVQRTDYVLDLGTSGANVPAAELSRLSAWFQSMELGYGDKVFVNTGYDDSGPRQDVARVAADYGLLLSEGSPVSAGRTAHGAVRVIVSRMTASVPGCPNWDNASSDPLNTGAGVSLTPNYGCATNSNLASMIADPSDLVLGQTGAPNDTSTAAKAIKVYRNAAPTGAKGLTAASTKSGN